jgi:excisionase family DNA binding protein|tara:strand:- start:540 stop:1025 length:486 start_codon:yes stop_codon:yes gene_type:complete
MILEVVSSFGLSQLGGKEMSVLGQPSRLKKVFTTGEVAKILKIGTTTVKHWFDKGKINGYRIPGGTQDRRIPREYLYKCIKEMELDSEKLGPGMDLTLEEFQELRSINGKNRMDVKLFDSIRCAIDLLESDTLGEKMRLERIECTLQLLVNSVRHKLERGN